MWSKTKIERRISQLYLWISTPFQQCTDQLDRKLANEQNSIVLLISKKWWISELGTSFKCPTYMEHTARWPPGQNPTTQHRKWCQEAWQSQHLGGWVGHKFEAYMVRFCFKTKGKANEQITVRYEKRQRSVFTNHRRFKLGSINRENWKNLQRLGNKTTHF